MNKKRSIVSLCLASVLSLCACSMQEQPQPQIKTPKEYTVVVQDSVFFTADVPSASIERGESFTTNLTFEYGYTYGSCNVDGAVATQTEDGVSLTIPFVGSDTRIIVTSKQEGEEVVYPERVVTITYDGNGGTWEDGTERYTKTYTLTYHFKANTDLAETLARKGYALYGWNTKADGTGEHVGLGSRTDAEVLYAEWGKCIDTSQFLYQTTEEGVTLTGYKGKGDVEPFVLPTEINGKPVVSVSPSFTTNMPCGKLTANSLILPRDIRTVSGNAFSNSSFTDLYFFEDIEDVADSAFPYNLKHYHINATLPVAFQKENDNARFADKIDYLSMQEGDRLVLFAGCSAAYGINSHVLSEEFPDYTVCNMGVIGGVNAVFQMQIIGQFLREGDLFVHMPEEASPFQLMAYTSLETRVFIMVEGNYDLLAYADFSENVGFWTAFKGYQKIKGEEPAGTYEETKVTYNRYGDIILGRPFTEENAWEQDISYNDNTYQFDLSYLTEKGIAMLCDLYDSYQEKGVAVYISYAPINADGIDDLSTVKMFEDEFNRLLQENGYQTMGSLEDHVFRGRYFYDADYHLNEFGALLQTRKIIDELKKVL